MQRKESTLAQEINSSPELLRLLTAKPKLYDRILAAAFIAEQYEAIKADYLSGTEAGFMSLSNLIALMEIPVSPATGEPLMDETGTNYIFPLADLETGETLYIRFAKWLKKRLIDAAYAEPKLDAEPGEATPDVTWDEPVIAGEQVSEEKLRALPNSGGRVN